MKKYFLLLVCFLSCIYIFGQNIESNELNIKAYLNDTEILGPVYRNVFQPPVQGVDYLGSFVRLTSIFELLNSEINIRENLIEIISKDIGHIGIIFEDQQNIFINHFTRELIIGPSFTNNSIIIITDEYFISISMVRYLISGSLVQDEEKVILYTNDYERLDIPLTLLDCFLSLDNILSDEVKDDIMSSSLDSLIRYHMGLGMWIRNNWIRQTNSRITGLLYENGLRHPDDMSQIIIVGYHYYLNGIIKPIEELIEE